MERQKQIVRVSLVGIAANLVLAGFKAAVGLLAGSVAVVLDAVNNLSDALSSIITIVGTRLAARAPDREHPYGHGRIENLTAVVIAVLVLLAGLASFRESVDKILHPVDPNYTAVSLTVIAAAVAVKLLLGRYVKAAGQRLNSDSLAASGADALFDAAISLSTLAAAVISMVWHIAIEGWLGAAISVVILRAGLDILLDSLNSIIGERIDSDLSTRLKADISSYGPVRGAYDLSLHRYGPEKIIGSVHIEVPEDMTAGDLHRLTRQIAADVYTNYGILLTVGIYASSAEGEEETALHRFVEETVAAHPGVLELHGYYLEPALNRVSFDLVMDFSVDAQAECEAIRSALLARYPEYTFDIILDTDISD